MHVYSDRYGPQEIIIIMTTLQDACISAQTIYKCMCAPSVYVHNIH